MQHSSRWYPEEFPCQPNRYSCSGIHDESSTTFTSHRKEGLLHRSRLRGEHSHKGKLLIVGCRRRLNVGCRSARPGCSQKLLFRWRSMNRVMLRRRSCRSRSDCRVVLPHSWWGIWDSIGKVSKATLRCIHVVPTSLAIALAFLTVALGLFLFPSSFQSLFGHILFLSSSLFLFQLLFHSLSSSLGFRTSISTIRCLS